VRFLLDENVPLRLRDSLLAKGFQVELVVEHLGIGASNHEVAEEATRIADTILTFDEDFLRLRPEIKQRVKVLYIKIHPRDPREARRLLDKWIDECVALLERGRLVKLTEKGPVLEEA
jgi:predicted nuclease of predicted toxin-antitoxin system